MRSFADILQSIQSGQTGSTAYDTSWIVRLSDIDYEMSNRAIQWISENQLPDGSWGTAHPYYYHDRVISTLSAMLALTYSGRRSQDRHQIEMGLRALEMITSGATRGLAADPNGATVGFELIVPALVAEAEELGIIQRQGDRILGKLKHLRAAKMEKLGGVKISRHITPAFSAEMAGTDRINLLDIERLQESNGSVGNSPSATAYFLRYIRPDDEKALGYLRHSVRDGAPFAYPFDVFERAWILWNLAITGQVDETTLQFCQPHLRFLKQAWKAGRGVGFARNYTPSDSDDTSVTLDALLAFGVSLDTETIFRFEERDHFRCYEIEATPSVGANVHILGALGRMGCETNHPAVQKIVNFLRSSRGRNKYWLDKWHTSPYYITAHAIIALSHYEKELCADSVQWILDTRKKNGSWGFYGASTAEETAYCIQALRIWQDKGAKIDPDILPMAARWLEDHLETTKPAMWISKVLYRPDLVVESILASALLMAKG